MAQHLAGEPGRVAIDRVRISWVHFERHREVATTRAVYEVPIDGHQWNAGGIRRRPGHRIDECVRPFLLQTRGSRGIVRPSPAGAPTLFLETQSWVCRLVIS